MTTLSRSQTLAFWREMLFEDADGSRPTNVMGHQHIDIDPNVIAGLNAGPMGSTGKDLSVRVIEGMYKLRSHDRDCIVL